MSNLFNLVEVMLKQTYRQKQNKSKKKKLLANLGFVILFLYIGSIFYFSSRDSLVMLAQMGQAHSYLSSILYSMSLYILMIALITTPTILYFSDDLKQYLSLPIPAEKLALAKAIALYVSNIISLAFIYIPIGFVYMYLTKMPLYFIVQYLIVGLILPIIPLSIATGVIVLLFRLFPKAKNEKAFTYLSTILSLILMFGIIFQTNGQEGTLFKTIGQISGLKILFPQVQNLVQWLDHLAWKKFFLSILLHIPYIVFAFLIFKTSYLKTALLSMEKTSPRKNKEKTERSRKAWRAYLHIDQANIFRTPVLLINYLLPIVTVPIAFGIPAFLGIKKEIDFTFSDIQTFSNLFLESLTTKEFIMGSILIPMIIFFFLTSMSSIASTSFSREGTNMKHFAALPIHYQSLFTAKYLLAIKFNFIPLWILFLIITFFLKIPLQYILLGSLTAFLGSSLPILLGIMIDSLKPKLIWDDETEALKKNLFAAIPAFLGMGIFFASIALFFLYPTMTTCLSYLSFVILINLLLTYFIKRFSEKSLQKEIEKIA